MENAILERKNRLASKENIADVLKKDFNIDMDKRKIEIKGDIKSAGDYTAVIKIHPTITANIKVHIVTK